MPRPGYPRMKRNEKYRLTQADLIEKHVKPNKIFQRRYTAFLPHDKKSITISEQLHFVEKLQKKSIENLSKRLQEEKTFLQKIQGLKTKVTLKIAESDKKKKEHNNTKNNTRRLRLKNEIQKLNNNLHKNVKMIPVRTKLEEIFKQDLQLQTAINQFFYGKLQNHLIYGNTQRAHKKRSLLIGGLMSHLRDNQREMYNNAIQVLKNTPGAREKLNKLRFTARNNQYRSKLTLPRSKTDSRKYNLPIKLNHTSGKRKTLKNIRQEYRRIQETEGGMNVNRKPENVAKKGPNNSNKKGKQAAAAAVRKNHNAQVSNIMNHDEQTYTLDLE